MSQSKPVLQPGQAGEGDPSTPTPDIVKFPPPDLIQQVITLPKIRSVLGAREKVIAFGLVVSPVFGREILDFEWDKQVCFLRFHAFSMNTGVCVGL